MGLAKADFEIFEEAGGGGGGAEEGGDHDDGALVVGEALVEIEAGEGVGRHADGEQPVDDGEGGPGEGEGGDGQQEGAAPRRQGAGEQRGERQRQQGGERDKRRQIEREGAAFQEAAEASEDGNRTAEAAFEIAAAGIHEKVAHVALAPVGAGLAALGGHGDDGFGDVHLGAPGVAGEFFDLGAVAVAGAEIHQRMDAGGIAPQDGLGGAQGFDELLPVHGGERAHAGDGVAGGDVVGGLGLVFALLGVIDGLAVLGEFLFDPVESQAEGGIDAVDVGDQLRDKRRGEGGGGADEIAEGGDELARIGFDDLEEAIGPDEGGVALAAAPGDALGDEVEVFDQRQPQHDGDGPEFAEGEGMDGLVGADEMRKVVGVHLAVAVADEFHDDIVDAGKSPAGPGGQAGQFAAVARREVDAGQFDLLLDQVIVVEQPLGGGGDAGAAAHAFGNDLVAAVDFIGASGELMKQLFRLANHFDLVVAGEDLRVVLELVDAEEFGAEGHFVRGGRLEIGAGGAGFVDPPLQAEPLPDGRLAVPMTADRRFGRDRLLRGLQHRSDSRKDAPGHQSSNPAGPEPGDRVSPHSASKPESHHG